MEAIKRGAWGQAPGLSERDRVLCGLAEKLSGGGPEDEQEDEPEIDLSELG